MGILTIIQGIAALIGQGFKQYQDRKIAEHEVIKAQLEAQRQLAMEKERAALELGREQIKATSSWFKHITFIMWFGPFILTTFLPEHGKAIFENWQVMPEWYAQSCVAIMFIIWGVQVGREYISNIFATAGAFFKKRSNMQFQRKLFYDIVRNTKGPLTENEVKLYEKAISAAEITKDS